MNQSNRRQFGVADALVAVIAISLLASLMAPSLAQSVADARRSACLEKVKQIAIPLLNFEATNGYFPTASTVPITGEPGNAEDSDRRAGFSWLARLLPSLDLFQGGGTRLESMAMALRDDSNRATASPFADSVRESAEPRRLIATIPIDLFVCPGFSGKPTVDVQRSDYESNESAGGAPAITNYFAMSATHLVKRDGGYFLDDRPAAVLQGNGGLPMFSADALKKGWQLPAGPKFDDFFHDGTSNTFMFCEGREEAYAAWIDGQVAWTVAAWPSNPELPTLRQVDSEPLPVLGWNDDDEASALCIAKQPYGPAQSPVAAYLPKSHWSGSQDRKFGPSGNHPGVTIHAFADCHADFISDDVDRNVYLHRTTRDGGETLGRLQ